MPALTIIPPPPFDLQAEENQILRVDNAIDSAACRAMCEYIEKAYARDPVIKNDQRTAFVLSPSGDMETSVCELMRSAVTAKVENFFGVTMEWWERVQFLRYGPGGAYGAHADAENRGKGETPNWKRVHDRDISILLYLNDTFTGGQLFFPGQGLTVTPSPGLLMAFPSDHRYQHAAQPTLDGTRYVMVTWGAITGSRRVRPEPPAVRFL